MKDENKNEKNSYKLYYIIAAVLVAFLVVSFYVFEKNKKDSPPKNIVQIENNVKKMVGEFYHENKGTLKDKEYVKKKITMLDSVNSYLTTELYDNLDEKDKNYYQTRKYLKRKMAYIASEMGDILYEYGWIKISEFGADADKKAFNVVYSANASEDLQYKTLFKLGYMVEQNETNRENYARLYDKLANRLSFMGIKQRYGTKGKKVDGVFTPDPYEGNLAELNSRRAQLGLSPILVPAKAVMDETQEAKPSKIKHVKKISDKKV